MEKSSVPVEPYNREIPNNNIQDENAEDNIIFMAASPDNTLLQIKIT